MKVLRVDLADAKIPYQVEGRAGPEFADFHALRHTFVTALSSAGVGPKERQELARHSDPRLTLGLYTRCYRKCNPRVHPLQPLLLHRLPAGQRLNFAFGPVSYTHLTLPTNREV